MSLPSNCVTDAQVISAYILCVCIVYYRCVPSIYLSRQKRRRDSLKRISKCIDTGASENFIFEELATFQGLEHAALALAISVTRCPEVIFSSVTRCVAEPQSRLPSRMPMRVFQRSLCRSTTREKIVRKAVSTGCTTGSWASRKPPS